MNYTSVCRIQALSSLVAGAVLLVVPGPLLALFGLPGDLGTQVLARMLGGVLWALGATLIVAKDASDRESRTRVCIGNAVCDGCVAMFLSAYTLRGALSATGWILVAIFAWNALSWLLALRLARAAA
jgi:hypothetical protein